MFIILFFNELIIDVSVLKNKEPCGATKECNKINQEIIRFFIRILIFNTVSSDNFEYNLYLFIDRRRRVSQHH